MSGYEEGDPVQVRQFHVNLPRLQGQPPCTKELPVREVWASAKFLRHGANGEIAVEFPDGTFQWFQSKNVRKAL